MCANTHATRHCDDEGYGIMSTYMVKFIHKNEELEMDSIHCDEELDNSKVNPTVQEDIVQNIPLMPMKMEITSIEDFKVQ